MMGPRDQVAPQPLAPFGLGKDEHWAAARGLAHPAAAPPHLDPGWHRLILIRRRWHHDLNRIRAEVINEVQAMEELQNWMNVRDIFSTCTGQTTADPLPRLPTATWPGTSPMASNGFQMMGQLRRAPGPTVPTASTSNFQPAPRQLAISTQPLANDQTARTHRNTHEGGSGRGSAWPRDWPMPATTRRRPPTMARNFQIDPWTPGRTRGGKLKVRRSEDWRWSGHNATARLLTSRPTITSQTLPRWLVRWPRRKYMAPTSSTPTVNDRSKTRPSAARSSTRPRAGHFGFTRRCALVRPRPSGTSTERPAPSSSSSGRCSG